MLECCVGLDPVPQDQLAAFELFRHATGIRQTPESTMLLIFTTTTTTTCAITQKKTISTKQ